MDQRSRCCGTGMGRDRTSNRAPPLVRKWDFKIGKRKKKSENKARMATYRSSPGGRFFAGKNKRGKNDYLPTVAAVTGLPLLLEENQRRSVKKLKGWGWEAMILKERERGKGWKRMRLKSPCGLLLKREKEDSVGGWVEEEELLVMRGWEWREGEGEGGWGFRWERVLAREERKPS